MIRIIPHEELPQSDLVVDAVYEGGHSGNTGDDPISKTLKGAGNQGGFRAAGIGQDKKFVVLYMPIKFGSALKSKLDKKYWEKPHLAGMPLMFAIQDFSAPPSMIFTR